MGWCPYCVWNRLHPDAQEALFGLMGPDGPTPQRIPGPIRNILVGEELVEFDHLEPGGAYWRASLRGRSVIRAGDDLKDDDDE